MDARRIAIQCQDTATYKENDRLIWRKCIQAKEKWFNERCEEIEVLSKKKPQLMHAKVKNLSNLKKCSSNGCIKGKDGSVVVDREEIIARWEEYIRELYDDKDRGVQSEFRKNMDGPPILENEISLAIKRMKWGRATGVVGISIERIIAPEGFGIVQLTKFANKLCDAGAFPEDLSNQYSLHCQKLMELRNVHYVTQLV